MSLVNDVLNDLAQRKYCSGDAVLGVSVRSEEIPAPVSLPVTQIARQTRNVSKMRMALTLFLSGIAVGSFAVHRTAQTPYIDDSTESIVPTYIQPQLNNDTSLKATEVDFVSIQKSKQQIRESKSTVVASKDLELKREPNTNKVQSNANRYLGDVKNDAVDINSPSHGLLESEFIEVIHHPLSAVQQRTNDFRKASNLYKTGDYGQAEMLLNDLLLQDDTQHQARILLAKLYMSQNQEGRAELVLARGLTRYPEEVSYVSLYAQILAAQGLDNAALEVLRRVLPVAVDNAEFHALLAGIYQRTGNSVQAASSYITALQIDSTRGEWWMGLGISSEQAGDTHTAESASRQNF